MTGAGEHIPFVIRAQPNDSTCGPTCLHAVYRHLGDELPFDDVMREVLMLELGGTLAVHLGNHALARGYGATLLTWNLQVFDPTWFRSDAPPLAEKLAARAALRPGKRETYEAYLRFLELGGKVGFVDLAPSLLRRFLRKGLPILTGLSATFLYRTTRERPDDQQDDDVNGEPVGHFVVLHGYDAESRQVMVSDPLFPNPFADEHTYPVAIERLIGAIFLGVLTHDANLLVLEPRDSDAHPGRRR